VLVLVAALVLVGLNAGRVGGGRNHRASRDFDAAAFLAVGGFAEIRRPTFDLADLEPCSSLAATTASN
jgi:hypothetical protein